MKEIDRVAIAGLEEQYGIPRSVLHDRMNALGIKRTKIGNKAYIDGEALHLLNDLDAHMKAKQPMALFLEKVGKQSTSQTDLVVAGQSDSQTEILIKAIAYLTSQQQPIDPWNEYEQLDRIAGKGWLIPTSQMLPLLGLKSIPLLDDHHRFRRRGFQFWRLSKVGREYEWRVSKIRLIPD